MDARNTRCCTPTWFRRGPDLLSAAEEADVYPGVLMDRAPAQNCLSSMWKVLQFGYRVALSRDDAAAVEQELEAVEPESRGIAFEGAAMGLTLLDLLKPRANRRFDRLVKGPGASYMAMLHAGRGMALARLGQSLASPVMRAHPMLGWALVNGYGFHQGYFLFRHYVQQQLTDDKAFVGFPDHLAVFARQIFDQGLGRSIWFLTAGDVAGVGATIAGFPVSRRADLWSGIGVASAYAGGVKRADLENLLALSSEFQPYLAEGAALSARIRERSSNQTAHTEMACKVFWGLSAKTVTRIVDGASGDLPAAGEEPPYGIWQQRIRNQFATGAAAQ